MRQLRRASLLSPPLCGAGLINGPRKAAFALISLVLIPPMGLAADKPESCIHSPTAFRCVKFVRNYDADTITVEIPNVHPLIGHEISVRVRGIDAPEIKAKGSCEKDRAKTAKERVRMLLSNSQSIDLVDVGRDKYFRILATVMVNGQELGEALLRENLAYEYDGGHKPDTDWCPISPKHITTKKTGLNR